ncbi:MAG: hypothetical protein HYR71_06360 [Chloroflexi bacterium]|nr:hypothetical protein [Chloroflexota bacterium]
MIFDNAIGSLYWRAGEASKVAYDVCGKELMNACIACATSAGFSRIGLWPALAMVTRREPLIRSTDSRVACAGQGNADRFADVTQGACSLFKLAYDVGVKDLPEGQSALRFMRNQLDRLGIGADLKAIPWGSKQFKLPPSKLVPEQVAT